MSTQEFDKEENGQVEIENPVINTQEEIADNSIVATKDDIQDNTINEVEKENVDIENIKKEETVVASKDKNKYKMRRKKTRSITKTFGKITAALLIILVVVCAFFGGYTTSSLLQSENAAVAEWLCEVLNKEAYYVDYEGLDAAFLMEYGLSFCLRNDPYCDLMTPEETAEYYATSSGSSTTFGVSVGTFEGIEGVYVVSVVMGSSAQKSGLAEGMRIVSIDGIDLYDKTMDDVSSILLSKESGETAYIECVLPSIDSDGGLYYSLDNETFSTTIEKREYTPIVVEYYDNQTAGLESLDDETAYIKITSFVGKTGEQFEEAMKWYQETGKSSLILDLRDNTGGSEENMRTVGSYLLKSNTDGKNPLIITIEDKYGNVEEIRAYNDYYDSMDFTNVIVLTNSYTASASEAILTAMIDYDTVDIIIGETTYGKGTGLTTMFMPVYGYSVIFTSSYYFSPDGNSHDQIGLSPTNGYSMLDSYSFPYAYDSDDILQRAIAALK